MQQAFKKIQRVQPIIKLKQSKVDEESVALAQRRAEKVEIVKQMKENQRRYMDGVEELNTLRTSRARSNLDTMEQALDYVKDQWWKLYKKAQEAERREAEQLAALLAAERELQAVMKLSARYEVEYQTEVKHAERKQLDEFAIRNFDPAAFPMSGGRGRKGGHGGHGGHGSK
jgi:flagellar biosynthesis chaperone FliJ